MQTFLPYPCFVESARSLDYRRLGKQRVETWQIFLSLTQPEYGWKNHPAVKMWVNYDNALLEYGIKICDEWLLRGYRDTLRERFVAKLEERRATGHLVRYPWWLGRVDIHRSHQSNLIRKDATYGLLFPGVPDDLPYVWPVTS
jgi:hypothetical protein